MNLPDFVTPKMTRTFYRSGLVLKKYSPQLLVGGGIAAGVYAAVLGAKAHLKAENSLAPFLQNIASLKAIEGEFNTENNTPSDYTKALAKLYGALGLELAKIYGPAVSLGAASIAAILSAHGLLSQRNAALMAGWKLLDEGFAAYRERIVDEFGPEADERAKYGMTAQKVKTVTKDSKTKKNKTTTTIQNVVPNYLEDSMYARMFDEKNPMWKNDHYMNIFFLRSKETLFNQQLIARGHVFLNEVYKELGIPETRAGQVAGWFLGDDGDNYVDFHLGDKEPEETFNDGLPMDILLDFNVDGVILDNLL